MYLVTGHLLSFPALKLALIYEDGMVYKLGVDSGKPEETLLKLPISEKYFGFSDDFGVLNFIHDRTDLPITTYTKEMIGRKDSIIFSSQTSSNMTYKKGLWLGKVFWQFDRKEHKNGKQSLLISKHKKHCQYFSVLLQMTSEAMGVGKYRGSKKYCVSN